MKLVNLSLSAAALLACGIGLASAQSTTAPGASSAQSKCWDAASGQIKDKMAANTPGSSASGSAAMKNSAQGNAATGSGAKAPGGVTTGSGAAGNATTGAPKGSAAARPPQAAGLPNC